VRKITVAAQIMFFACASLLMSAAAASAWPDRTVRFLVPLGPGSGVDITARLVGDSLSKKWGQPVIIENRPGGDGIIAVTGFIGTNDDHTLLFTPTGAFSSHPYTQEKIPYDPKALSPIARVTNTIVAFAVPTSLNINSLKELLDMVKAQPGKLNWASATATNEFLFQGYLKENNLDMAKVPYRDTVSAINDLSEGRIQFYVGAYAIMRPQLQSGKVKVLAILNRERAKGASDIPTAREAGFPGLEFDGLVGIFGPNKMPDDVRAKIAADVKQVVSDTDISTKLTATGQNVSPGTPAEFAAAYQAQIAQVDAVAKLLGLKRAQ
jgi:tripartite-type tricarboxylate transporter receptor subunit TctC